ncbi:unnamed protein product [Symbiodinium pilosum]|uniref:Uncharacterized protein n=1 Tax=Symbiodinium pilosum TaxID=2952 RepID=A0A812UVT2_SYMPI|nr:unnamed protein product [Symbiodinium pilosum]
MTHARSPWRSRRNRGITTVLALFAVAAALFMRAAGAFCGGLQLPSGRGREARTPRLATTIEGDEFKAARERIRRIQLGLGPNDPLPEEDEEPAEADPNVVPGPATGTLDLAEATDGEAVEAKVSGDVAVTNATDEEDVKVQDAFAGSEKDVPELQPEKSDKPKKEEKFILLQLVEDPGL